MSSAASGDPVIIIGAGPAGLAVAHTLAKRKIDYVLLEKGSSVASALRQVDPDMTLLSPTPLSLMPDMKVEPGAPAYLPFKLLVHELERYQQKYVLNVTLNRTVIAVRRERVGFLVRYRTGAEESSIHGSHVVNATGIISKPKLPENFKPGATTIPWMHSIDARAEHLTKSRNLLLLVAEHRRLRYLRTG